MQESLVDRFVMDFQMLRLAAGDASYAQIAQRVRRLREERGVSEAAAYVGRSTVYDAFRPGRRRINAALVADIATVLGEDAERAEHWREYCVRAQAEAGARTEAAGPAAPPAGSERSADPIEAPAAPVPAQRASPPPVATSRRLSAHSSFLVVSILIVAVGVAVNMGGSLFVRAVGLPLYLDMMGTAIVSLALGPWYGVAAAIATHGLFAVFETTLVGLPFALVNIAGALVWGYGVRRWRLGRSPARVLLLSVIAAVCSTLVATAVIMFFFDGFSINAGAHALSGNLVAAGHQIWGAVFSANMITSLMDKLISGFVALAVVPYLLRPLAGGEGHRIGGFDNLLVRREPLSPATGRGAAPLR
ncbi:hypothetical protein H9651_08930 [Microbacterium sp. Sa4CUA7]|uniref:ECF transporter S component n=1 Tax=Microbacterium pullorum TaxID=2762236 RepID=A0ABR8S2R3_9MICO|nr:hypothetical protein [Microbacterium pullorum]MBD7957761.1 hypothetical protein [Microbacterium pullorum]